MKSAPKKIAASLVALIGGAAACGNSGTPASATHPPKVYAVIATEGSPSGLPRCTSALRGDTVMVSSPPSLWYCGNDEWEQIVCDTSLAGDVAYASASGALWACVSGAWTRIALPDAGPAGPQGPQGPTGDAGPVGATGSQGALGVGVMATRASR